jgi:hypothetical protein
MIKNSPIETDKRKELRFLIIPAITKENTSSLFSEKYFCWYDRLLNIVD